MAFLSIFGWEEGASAFFFDASCANSANENILFHAKENLYVFPSFNQVIVGSNRSPCSIDQF